jgi:hypothetical protein
VRVAVISAFRDAAGQQVARWLGQVAGLAAARPGWSVRAVAVEGDSRDRTRDELVDGARARGLELELVTANHGGPRWGSVEDPRRMAALSLVLNAGMGAARIDDEAVLYVESDLLWDADTAVRLLELVSAEHPVVAPLVFAGEHFYDVWGFRKNGQRFSPLPPYHAELVPTGLTEVDSAGSCLAMLSVVARSVRVKDGNALVGWCAEARAIGYRIHATSDLSVRHPA